MLNKRHFDADDEQWAPVSDLMAAVMLIFMLISMLLFVNFDLGQRSHEKKCEQSWEMLKDEFEGDFSEWGAKLDKDLTIRFTNQKVLFGIGSSEVERNSEGGGWFAKMLRDFFPRYMRIIRGMRTKFGAKEVVEVRIEGHTSSEHGNPGPEGAFIKNMELSQDRARKILHFVLDANRVPQSAKYKKMAHELITANGLSSSRLKCREDGLEDQEASRRVEFKLLTNSCQQAGFYDKIPRVKDPTCFLVENSNE